MANSVGLSLPQEMVRRGGETNLRARADGLNGERLAAADAQIKPGDFLHRSASRVFG